MIFIFFWNTIRFFSVLLELDGEKTCKVERNVIGSSIDFYVDGPMLMVEEPSFEISLSPDFALWLSVILEKLFSAGHKGRAVPLGPLLKVVVEIRGRLWVFENGVESAVETVAQESYELSTTNDGFIIRLNESIGLCI